MPHPYSQPDPQRPGPTLVTTRPAKHSLLALWHLLSLDAPTVAALWTIFIAHAARLSLPWTAPAAMFTAVWMIYAADRLLDARILEAQSLDASPMAPAPQLEARHRFHHNHRRVFLGAILLASAILATLLHRIDPRALHLYAVLATLLAAYLLLIHARAAQSHRLPKELAVGLFFPAAVFIPTVARAPELRVALLPAATLFAAVCTLNCLFLFAWEHKPRLHRNTIQPAPTAHWTTRWATQHLTVLALLLIAVAVAVAEASTSPIRAPAMACAVSAALLLLLHRHQINMRPIHLRATADLVLLTPVLFLGLSR